MSYLNRGKQGSWEKEVDDVSKTSLDASAAPHGGPASASAEAFGSPPNPGAQSAQVSQVLRPGTARQDSRSDTRSSHLALAPRDASATASEAATDHFMGEPTRSQVRQRHHIDEYRRRVLERVHKESTRSEPVSSSSSVTLTHARVKFCEVVIAIHPDDTYVPEHLCLVPIANCFSGPESAAVVQRL